jgi:hypothetical protein
MLRPSRPSTAALSLFFLAASHLSAASDPRTPPRTREDCRAAYPAAWGQAGKDVPWVPTLDAVTLTMLSIAQVAPQDHVLDLGAGDGRIAVASAKPPFAAQAVGIEYDAELARLASCLVRVEGLADRVRIVQGGHYPGPGAP